MVEASAGRMGITVIIVNAGADPGNHTGGVSMADGQTTVWFERSMAPFGGTSPITCTSTAYSGNPLGIGLVSNVSGTHMGPNGETFNTSSEGDVEMNQGTSTCAYYIGLGDFNSSVTHEIGHTLGFRHSDQDRTFGAGTMACSTDMSLECSTNAIMKAYIPSMLNGALQTLDSQLLSAAGKTVCSESGQSPARNVAGFCESWPPGAAICA